MKRFQNQYRDESGFVLVTSMLLLVILTVIGVAATQTSMFDIMLSSSEMKKQEAFYAAEGGLDHGSVVVLPIMNGNIDEDADDLRLTFLLDGSQSGLDAATDDDFEGGSVVIDSQSIGDGYTYSVRIYNNRDGGGATEDRDGLVILGSRAQKVDAGASQVEIGLRAFLKEFTEETYQAQEGAGGTKNYNANDAGTVDFSVKSGNDRIGQKQLDAS